MSLLKKLALSKRKNNLISMLQDSVKDGMPLTEIVDAFEKMCQVPMEEDMILFETGTYKFTGEPLFYFSMTRQFPNGGEEFYQLHLDVMYSPNEENKAFKNSVWNEDIGEDIFKYIKESETFKYASADKYLKIKIYMDET